MEVGGREVGTEAHAAITAGAGELADHVTPERGGRRLVIGRVGVEQCEAVVVLGGEDHVLLAGVASEVDPLGGVEALGRELLRERLVLAQRDRLDRHLDLAGAQTVEGLDEPALELGAEHHGP